MTTLAEKLMIGQVWKRVYDGREFIVKNVHRKDATASPSPIKLARFLRGLSQEDLACQAGTSRETISRLERGESPRLTTARAVATALGVGVNDLFPTDSETPAESQAELADIEGNVVRTSFTALRCGWELVRDA